MEPLKIFANDPLLFEPGTKFSYTTYGFNLLGAAVESVSGLPFMEYLKQNVFAPAHMEHIAADDVYAIIPHRARGYRLSKDGRIENCALADTSNKIPAGGLIATATDLVRFALAVNSGGLLKKQTVEQMFTAQNTRDGKPTTYGMGWFIETVGGRPCVGHSGGQQGVATDLVLYPDLGIAIAVMTDREHAPVSVIANRIAKVVLEGAGQ